MQASYREGKMMKASSVCVLLALNIAQALKLQNGMEASALAETNPMELLQGEALSEEYITKIAAQHDPKLPLNRDPHNMMRERPKIKPGTGEVLKSGDELALESEVEPGQFVTLRQSHGYIGNPKQWLDYKRITEGIMDLRKGIGENSTFVFHNEKQGEIVSGDSVAWKHGNGQISVNAEGEWPWRMEKGEGGNSFLVEHAREVDLHEMTGRSPLLLAPVMKTWGYDPAVIHDARKGQPIKDGDSVWLKYKAAKGIGGPFLYLSGDVGEGYHVAFVHHFPGYDGLTKHYSTDHWNEGGNDPHATSNRFTIRKISK